MKYILTTCLSGDGIAFSIYYTLNMRASMSIRSTINTGSRIHTASETRKINYARRSRSWVRSADIVSVVQAGSRLQISSIKNI
jgi:hypothetical protein